MADLTHFDETGAARMVDVSDKGATERIAVARGTVLMKPETLAMVVEGRTRKGDVLSVARLAGIMGAKKTSDLIPLCHPLPLNSVTVDLSANASRSCVDIEACVRMNGRTGVEMEALVAVSTAALTVYDMIKSVDRGVRIVNVHLALKDGGKSGRYEAPS